MRDVIRLEGDFGDSAASIARLVNAIAPVFETAGRFDVLDLSGCSDIGATAAAVIDLVWMRAELGEQVTRGTSASWVAPSSGASEEVRRLLAARHPPPDVEFVPLQRFERHAWNDADPFVGLVARHVVLSADDVEYLRACLAEVYQNVEDHSRSPLGGVGCGRYARDAGAVGVAVVDLGVGIRESLRTRFPEFVTDGDALFGVLTRSISARSTNRNLGQGLEIGRASCRERV